MVVSVIDVATNPTDPLAWAGLAGDVVDLIPGVTGVGEAIRTVNTRKNAVNVIENIIDGAQITDKFIDAGQTINSLSSAGDTVVDSYRALRKVNKGNGKEVHHIIEKRFAPQLGIKDTNGMSSVALNKEDHLVYTKRWRKELPYGNVYSREEITQGVMRIYQDEPILLEAAKKTLSIK